MRPVSVPFAPTAATAVPAATAVLTAREGPPGLVAYLVILVMRPIHRATE
jgi:hypothetical protein